MKRFSVFLILPAILLFACQDKIVEETVEKFPDGTPKLVRYYKQTGDVKDLVKEKQYYPDHNLFCEGEYKENRKHGEWIDWYKNGNKWSEGYYKNGFNDGQHTVYHENGKKYYEGSYNMGKMTGKWKFWNENGQLTKEIDYD